MRSIWASLPPWRTMQSVAPAHQAVHDEFVETRGHQGETVALVHTQLALKDPHGNPPKGG